MDYVAVVKKAKETARDILRMELISARLARISTLKKDKEARKTTLEAYSKAVELAKYELSKLDQQHPLFEESKLAHERNVAEEEKALATETANLAALDKKTDEAIAESEKAIEDIKSGKTLVCKDRLASLTDCLIFEYGKDQLLS